MTFHRQNWLALLAVAVVVVVALSTAFLSSRFDNTNVAMFSNGGVQPGWLESPAERNLASLAIPETVAEIYIGQTGEAVENYAHAGFASLSKSGQSSVDLSASGWPYSGGFSNTELLVLLHDDSTSIGIKTDEPRPIEILGELTIDGGTWHEEDVSILTQGFRATSDCGDRPTEGLIENWLTEDGRLVRFVVSLDALSGGVSVAIDAYASGVPDRMPVSENLDIEGAGIRCNSSAEETSIAPLDDDTKSILPPEIHTFGPSLASGSFDDAVAEGFERFTVGGGAIATGVGLCSLGPWGCIAGATFIVAGASVVTIGVDGTVAALSDGLRSLDARFELTQLDLAVDPFDAYELPKQDPFEQIVEELETRRQIDERDRRALEAIGRLMERYDTDLNGQPPPDGQSAFTGPGSDVAQSRCPDPNFSWTRMGFPLNWSNIQPSLSQGDRERWEEIISPEEQEFIELVSTAPVDCFPSNNVGSARECWDVITSGWRYGMLTGEASYSIGCTGLPECIRNDINPDSYSCEFTVNCESSPRSFGVYTPNQELPNETNFRRAWHCR